MCTLSFAKTPQAVRNNVADLSPAIHFTRILNFDEGQALSEGIRASAGAATR